MSKAVFFFFCIFSSGLAFANAPARQPRFVHMSVEDAFTELDRMREHKPRTQKEARGVLDEFAFELAAVVAEIYDPGMGTSQGWVYRESTKDPQEREEELRKIAEQLRMRAGLYAYEASEVIPWEHTTLSETSQKLAKPFFVVGGLGFVSLIVTGVAHLGTPAQVIAAVVMSLGFGVAKLDYQLFNNPETAVPRQQEWRSKKGKMLAAYFAERYIMELHDVGLSIPMPSKKVLRDDGYLSSLTCDVVLGGLEPRPGRTRVKTETQESTVAEPALEEAEPISADADEIQKPRRAHRGL